MPTDADFHQAILLQPASGERASLLPKTLLSLCRPVATMHQETLFRRTGRTHGPALGPLAAVATSPRRSRRRDADPCFICRGLAEDDDRENLIVLRTPRSVVVLNRFPYNNGHLLVAPRAHKGRPRRADADELLETQETLRAHGPRCSTS